MLLLYSEVVCFRIVYWIIFQELRTELIKIIIECISISQNLTLKLRHSYCKINIFVATLTALRLEAPSSISNLRTRNALVARDKINWKILMTSGLHSGWLFSLVTALCRCGLRMNISYFFNHHSVWNLYSLFVKRPYNYGPYWQRLVDPYRLRFEIVKISKTSEIRQNKVYNYHKIGLK